MVIGLKLGAEERDTGKLRSEHLQKAVRALHEDDFLVSLKSQARARRYMHLFPPEGAPGIICPGSKGMAVCRPERFNESKEGHGE